MDAKPIRKASFIAILVLAIALAGCDADSSDNSIVLSGEFAVAFVDRPVAARTDPIDPIRFTPGGDLYLLDMASPSAKRRNVTGRYTQGRGDVSSPDVSYDATRIVFSMRGPADPTWNIWEYVIATGELRRVIADDDIANRGDDLMPTYLPDGRIVFVSNRQHKSRGFDDPTQAPRTAYLDEYRRHPASVLHVVDADGSNLEQISFNLSHDRDPTVLLDGRIVFSRWENMGSRSEHVLFVTHPDGTAQSLYYGAGSPGNSYLQARELADGRLIATVAPLTGSGSGGALALIDIAEFADVGHPVPGSGATGSGQRQASYREIPLDRELSAYGRFTAPFPIWDGKNRVLAAFTPYRAALRSGTKRGQYRAGDGTPHYGIYVLDLDTGAQRAIALPRQGRMLTDPLAILPRPAPAILPRYQANAALAAEDNGLGGMGMGILNLKSVYDPGFLALDDERLLREDESVPRTPEGLVDLRQLRDPALTRAADRPARFVRISRGLPAPPGLPRSLTGASEFPGQQILGYAQVEPDGSVRVKVPADVPLSVAVVDIRGRALQTLMSWTSVRPGEEHICHGCRLPRHNPPLNQGKEAGPWENSVARYSALAGETQAETRTRVGPPLGELPALELRPHIAYRDVWTDPVRAGRPPDEEYNIVYTTGPGGVLKETAEPRDGIINYPQHIQYGLWERPRGSATCYSCHHAGNMNGGLDLSGTVAPSGRLRSYELLTRGRVVRDPETGELQLQIHEGQPMLVREPALVQVGRAGDGARTSRLFEKLIEEPEPGERDHRGMLNAAELRLLAEWLDTGAQYYNDPFVEQESGNDSAVRDLDVLLAGNQALSRQFFAERVHPILMSNCASCHRSKSSATPPDPLRSTPGLHANRFILTGHRDGDFGAARAMVSDVCEPTRSDLLAIPSSTGERHPSREGEPLLPAGEPNYLAILEWLTEAAVQAGCAETLP